MIVSRWNHYRRRPYNGPLGATGIGEMTMISTAPAIINAIYNACGAGIHSLPARPEKVLAALAGK